MKFIGLLADGRTMKKSQLLWILGTTIFLAGCASSPSSKDLEAHINLLEQELSQLEITNSSQSEKIDGLESTQRIELEELSQKIALVETERDSYSQEIQQLERTNKRLEDRIRSLESLLRELSFAVSLVPRSTDPSPSTTPEVTEPRNPGVTPEMIAEVNAILFDLPHYTVVQSVFPYQRENRSSREFIAGSTVFTEINQDTRTQYFYDTRANYSTRSSVYPEIRQTLESRTLRPTGLAQFWIHIQAASDPSSGNLELQGLEFHHPREGRITITEPGEVLLLQDATTKLDRVSFALNHSNIRSLVETLTAQEGTAPPTFILIGKNQRIRISVQEVEVSALIEILQAYRDLGGPIPQ